jgi:signal transduction histidine kinase
VKIRAKVIILLLSVFATLALVEWGVERVLLLPRFEQIEVDSAQTAMRRVRFGVGQALAGLQVSANDWGNWADTYRFMQDHNPGYVHENLAPAAMRQLHLTALAFIDLDGRVVISRALAAGALRSVDEDLFPGGEWSKSAQGRRNLAEGRPVQGLIATRDGVMLAAMSPVLDGFGHGPARGMVFMGRLLTQAEVADIGARAQTDVVLEGAHRHGGPPLVPAAGLPVNGADPIVETDATTSVRHTFVDVDGAPVLTLRVDLPRRITAGAATTVAYARLFTFGAALAVLLLVLIVLDRSVLTPLSRVTRHASAIGSGDDLTPRLGLARRDEIGTLAGELDHMVDRLAESRRRLIDNSFESGRAELARGILHNIGNAMTPLGVRVARLQARLRDAPVADLERALAARASEPAGTERQLDLDAFVRLVATELAEAIREGEADVEVIARQSGAVQAALTDQLRSSRGGTVIEPVDLRALIDQTLEIVPDTCRDEIQLLLDPSLASTGTVRVPRTVLRLVLQNLVINAAEATRAAGRGRRPVRLDAALAPADSGAQLQITCADEGVGIDPAHLERVFERGFSTKGDAGNRGIGLHWCATAVASIGGRIWATSDGAGRGAQFHLSLPVPDSTPVPATRAA